MSSGMARKLLDEIRSGVQERLQERIDAEASRTQIMDITRAAAALLDANAEEQTIEMLLSKYWSLRPSEAHRFTREGEEKRKI